MNNKGIANILLEPHKKKIRKVIELSLLNMHEHYNKRLGFVRFLAYTCYSRRHFRRVFKKFMGCSPTEYLMKVRIEKAIKLLKETDNSIDTIIENCGFSNRGCFYKHFIKYTGVTPNSFRKDRISSISGGF